MHERTQSIARVLPAVVQAAGDNMNVLADFGIRSGMEVMRMLALGAKGVLLGHTYACALAAAGQRDVARVLSLIEHEMQATSRPGGATSIGGVDRALLAE